MRNILEKELGVPKAVASYLIRLNRSITKLEKVDKLPEQHDRQVLLNTSGRPNPNLPKDIQKLIVEILEMQPKDSLDSFLKSDELKGVLPEG